MGKAGYRKFLKKERARVKLKGSKKLLPKGQNLTDTNFKVKKIVIKDQIKEHLPGERLSKKKLNLKELLSRLGHHNTTVKQDALDGLKELVVQHPNESLGFELAQIIEGITKLILDIVPDVRKNASKLLSHILSQVPLTQLTPMFPSLCSHLLCGLTHIEHSIREDSLYLLDALLLFMPTLCVNQVSKLLPICLDLVSETTTGSRALSLHLDSKLGAGKWRGKVLARILTLLSAVVHSNEDSKMNTLADDSDNNCRKIKWEPDTHTYVSLYPPKIMNLKHKLNISLDSIDSEEAKSDFDFKVFSSSLIPLLLDAFMELAPQSDDKVGLQESGDNAIPVQAAAFLLCTVEIIQCLWDILQKNDIDGENVKWMRKTFGNTLLNRLVIERFPFSTKLDKVRKSKKNSENMIFFLQADNIEPGCYNVNLKLSKLTVHLCDEKHWKLIISYLKNCLRTPEKLGDPEYEALVSCFSSICYKSKGKEGNKIVSSVAKLCASSHTRVSSHFFNFLVRVALDTKLVSLQNGPEFDSWLASLPKSLLSQTIPGEYLDAISQISSRGFSAFSKSFDGYIEAILDNIPNIKVTGRDQHEVQMKLVDLLFWVEDWDEEFLNEIIKGIQNEYWGPSVTKHVKEILIIAAECEKSSTLSEFLKLNEWWKENVS